jgi:GrpB-like predicted nucleotidyltransferase (UPF0157 family)
MPTEFDSVTILGLRRGWVELVDHQVEWAVDFQRQREALFRVVGHLLVDVQHVGSTAVPELVAKPIIDIAAAVRTPADLPEFAILSGGEGWLDRGDKGPEGGYRLFVKESASAIRTHHLHVVPHTVPGWAEYTRFRDALIRDARLRTEYGSLKRGLQARFREDRVSYTAAKTEFIRKVLSLEQYDEA